MGLQSPRADITAIDSHKQPTSRITSVDSYAFWKTVKAAFLGERREVILIHPATIIFAMQIILSGIILEL
jgi:hypothetical protein